MEFAEFISTPEFEKLLKLSSRLFSFILMTFALLLGAKRKYIFASLLAVLSILSARYLSAILLWSRELGGDSFLETNNFDFDDALFFLSTFTEITKQKLSKSIQIIVATTVVAYVAYIVIKKRKNTYIYICALILIALAQILLMGYASYYQFKLSREIIYQLEKDFSTAPSGFAATKNDIDMFVYIGESTSSLNMSLYGYPVSTTPRLDALYRNEIGFLRFDEVRSTHTHTSPSLARALAISAPQKNKELAYWGIASVIKQSGLRSKLYSVQPLNGSFAASSRFIFSGADFDLAKEDKLLGNHSIPKLKDHQLLEKALQDSRGGVVLFHSYAGHGDYLKNIDTSLSSTLPNTTISTQGIIGSSFTQDVANSIRLSAADYDRAITYIDRNIAHAIENLKSRNKPSVFIYFSDHGDSSFTLRGHDSSRFIDEMSTVPMILYFNDSYRNKYPEVFNRYKKSSTSRATKFLDQVSPTILDILGITSTQAIDVPSLDSINKHPRPYILERDTIYGKSKIVFDYDSKNGFLQSKFVSGTPEPTYISIIDKQFNHENKICYHRSNSVAKSLRAASVASCIEFDLVVDGDNLNVYHPPSGSTGFRIEHIFNIAQHRKNSLWIDAKNINDSAACEKLTSYLEKNHKRAGEILVGFPPKSVDNISTLLSCGQKLKALKIRTSYYVPTDTLTSCAEDSSQNNGACRDANSSVQKAISSGIFTDLSFDFSGYAAIKKIKGAEALKWNTWTVDAKKIHLFPRQDFDFIIMDTSSDPNTY